MGGKRWFPVGTAWIAAAWAIMPILGAEPASQPTASEPAASASAPADPAVERILDRLERKKVAVIRTNLRFTKFDPGTGETHDYEGTLLFKDDQPNPRFRIQFDKHTHEGVVSKDKEWHIFDGNWYTEAREKGTSIVKRELVRQGESTRLFRIGKGPFPLPFGQKKNDVLSVFSVRLVPPAAKTDLPDADHLECTPLSATEMSRKYATVHFYVDRKSDLPVRVRTVEKEGGKQTTVTFSDAKSDVSTTDSELGLPPGVSVNAGYTEHKEPLSPPLPVKDNAK